MASANLREASFSSSPCIAFFVSNIDFNYTIDSIIKKMLDDEEAYKVFPKMDYKTAVPEAAVSSNDFLKPRSFSKGPFVPVNNNSAQSDLLATSKPNLSGTAAKSSGAYVPKQEGVKAPSDNDKKKENSGLFGKFKRGLFN